MSSLKNSPSAGSTGSLGFTYVELLVAGSLLMVSFLALAGMFVMGYSQVNGAGNTTMGLAAARQLLEDARRLPYDTLINLNGFDTEDPSTLPGDNPEREVARRWRYALAGEGVGWSFTADEKARWPSLEEQGDSLSASGRIQATQVSATLTRVTVSVSVPGRWRPIQVATFIADL
jgi:Tfp pilus assembly protein PilV